VGNTPPPWFMASQTRWSTGQPTPAVDVAGSSHPLLVISPLLLALLRGWSVERGVDVVSGGWWVVLIDGRGLVRRAGC